MTDDHAAVWPSLPELRDGLRRGTWRAVDLLARCHDRIAGVDPLVRAIVALDPSADAAARESDRRFAEGAARALEGVPVLVKDNIDTAGLATTAGSRLLAVPPVADADVVAMLRAAGAVVAGKTAMTEWGNFRSTAAIEGWSGVGGQTANPFALTHSPWGSSSGSAVAVATGMAPVAFGTETDGSIVCPAAVNGVVGVKPARGLLPTRGVVPISPEVDTVGVLCGSVADATFVLAALGMPPAPPVRAPRVGYWPGRRMDAEVLAVADRVVARVEHVPVELTFDGPMLVGALDALIAEFRPALEGYLATRPGVPSTVDELIAANRADPVALALFGQELFELAAAVTGEDRVAARAKRAAARAWARAEVTAALGDLDAIVAPTCGPAWLVDPAVPPPITRATSTYAALAGLANVTVPMGSVGGLPVGLSVFGPATTGATLAVAGAVAAVCGPRPVPNCRSTASSAAVGAAPAAVVSE
ncbi:amidase family protein [Actinophytocola xinjiangensis]|uniref:amidase family protein n=1 Tax=Actinophytocola xinjiangensis TaxID=485602 RepID=UPI0009FC0B95|nr:amidase family protein [Actinophytocola xinjiangensis]